jgi:quinol monooxygenase YgiN
MFTVIAKLKARADKLEETKKILHSLVVPVLLQDGCLQFDVHQSTKEPGTFFLYENWINDECLRRHLSIDYNNYVNEKSGELLVQPMEIFLLSRI